MGDLGLQGAYGQSALRAAIMQRLQMQRASEQQAFQNDLALRSSNRADQQMSLQDQLHRDQLAETKRQHDEADKDRTFKEDQTINESVPADTFLESSNPVIGRLQRVGAVRKQEARPAVDVGPLLPGDTGAAKQEGFLKNATAKQNAAAVTAADKTADNERQAKRDDATNRHQLAMEKIAANKPAAMITVQTVENGVPVTKIVPKTAGATFEKPASATTQTRLDSAQAVTQTGNDIIAKLSDPKIKALVGPSMGRYNTLRDFIGDPPPELSGLAGQIESYALANMGVHGMRSVAGAEKISHLLDQKHTPESMIEAIKGLNGFSEHFLQNKGRTPAGAAPAAGKPSAADLIKKYGG